MKLLILSISLLLVVTLTACVRSQEVSNSVTKSDRSIKADLFTGSKLNVQLGVGYMQRGQYKIAKEKLEKAIKQNPDNFQAYSTLALLMHKLNKNDAAEDYYLTAVDLAPDDAWLHNSYGAFLCSIGNLEDAITEFKLAYDDPFYETAYLARSNAGSCLVKNGKYVEAEVILRKALRSDSKLSGALLSMAEIGVKTKKYLMSRAYIQRYHADNRPTAGSLWIQIQVEKALDADEHYLKFSKQLLKYFPDSSEADLLVELKRKDKFN